MPEVTRCRRCSRPIWVEKSVERGIGPKCWARLRREGGLEAFLAEVEKEAEAG